MSKDTTNRNFWVPTEQGTRGADWDKWAADADAERNDMAHDFFQWLLKKRPFIEARVVRFQRLMEEQAPMAHLAMQSAATPKDVLCNVSEFASHALDWVKARGQLRLLDLHYFWAYEEVGDSCAWGEQERAAFPILWAWYKQDCDNGDYKPC